MFSQVIVDSLKKMIIETRERLHSLYCMISPKQNTKYAIYIKYEIALLT